MKQIHDFFVSETVNGGRFANNIIREKEEMFPGFMKAVLDGIAFFLCQIFFRKTHCIFSRL